VRRRQTRAQSFRSNSATSPRPAYFGPTGFPFVVVSAEQIHVGADIEHRTIVAPIAIGRSLSRVDDAEVRAVGAENMQAARTGGK